MTYDNTVSDIIVHVSMAFIEVLMLMIFFINSRVSLKGLHGICLCWIIVITMSLTYNGDNIVAIARCVAWPLLFEATYLLVKSCPDRIKGFRILFYGLMLMGLFYFLQSLIYSGFQLQTNLVYFLLLPIPYLLLTNKTFIRNFLMVLFTVSAMLSMKKSMMLSVVVFWFFLTLITSVRTGKFFQTLFFSISIAGVMYFSFSFVNSLSMGALTNRFEVEDISSGRSDIYDTTLLMISTSSWEQWLLGHGHLAVARDNPDRYISAHNEWLEVLYDYGILILLLYAFFWIKLIRRWIYLIKNRSPYLVPYTMSISIFLVMSMVSQLIVYVSYFLYLVIFWASVEALCSDEMDRKRGVVASR